MYGGSYDWGFGVLPSEQRPRELPNKRQRVDTEVQHCDAVEVFTVTDPNLAQSGGFISWRPSREDEEAVPKEWAGEETVIAESADVDRETAAALREKRMPKPPDAWFRRVAAMQLRSPTAADVQYCRAVFELRAAAVIELLAYRREAVDVSRIDHNSYHSVQLAAYARCLVTAEISSRLPAWPLALPCFGAFVGPDKPGTEEKKPYEAGQANEKRAEWRLERAKIESYLRTELAEWLADGTVEASDASRVAASLVHSCATVSKPRDIEKVALRVRKEVAQSRAAIVAKSAAAGGGGDDAGGRGLTAEEVEAVKRAVRKRGVPAACHEDSALPVMQGVARAGFASLEAYVEAKVKPRITTDSAGRESTRRLSATQRAAWRLHKCQLNERKLRRRNDLKERTFRLLLGAPPPIVDDAHGLLRGAAWFYRHRRNCFHVLNDKSLDAHPWIAPLRAALPPDPRTRVAAEALAVAQEAVAELAEAAGGEAAAGAAGGAAAVAAAASVDAEGAVAALHAGLSGEEGVTEALVAAMLPPPSTLEQHAHCAVLKALLLDPSGDNVAAARSLPAAVVAPLLARVVHVARRLLHRDAWSNVLLDLDELAPHSRRRAFGKRMHYQSTPGSGYYVLTHVSRIVAYFHAEELHVIHCTPRTPLAIDIYPSGVAVRVRGGAAVDGNLVREPLATWTEFVAAMSRTPRAAAGGAGEESGEESDAADEGGGGAAASGAPSAPPARMKKLTQVGRDLLTLLLQAPAIFDGAAQAADVLGLRLLPPSLRTAAALSIARDGDADAAREAVAAFAAFWAEREECATFARLVVPRVHADLESQLAMVVRLDLARHSVAVALEADEEAGPCIVRARGAREHGKDPPPSCLVPALFWPLAPSLLT